MSAALRLVRAKASLLARRPTKLPNVGEVQHPSDKLSRLYLYIGLEKQVGQDIVLQGRFHTAMLSKL
jgi:midasin